MQIVSRRRSGGLAMVLAAAVIALPALAQTQTQPAQPAPPAPQQAQTGVYSGSSDAAAKQTPDTDCQAPAGTLGAKSPEELQKALAASKSPTYSGTAADEAAKQAAATCGN